MVPNRIGMIDPIATLQGVSIVDQKQLAGVLHWLGLSRTAEVFEIEYCGKYAGKDLILAARKQVIRANVILPEMEAKLKEKNDLIESYSRRVLSLEGEKQHVFEQQSENICALQDRLQGQENLATLAEIDKVKVQKDMRKLKTHIKLVEKRSTAQRHDLEEMQALGFRQTSQIKDDYDRICNLKADLFQSQLMINQLQKDLASPWYQKAFDTIWIFFQKH